MVLSATKSLQLLGMHALTGCDGTSYPYAKGKVIALKTMLAGDFSDLDDVLGEEGVTQADLMKMAITFFIAMCGLPRGTSIESARFAIFAKTRKSQKSWLYLQSVTARAAGPSADDAVESGRRAWTTP